MPQLGHAFVGLGLGAATAREPRSAAAACSWIGVIVLASYGPDVLEWLLALGGARLPHGATSAGVTTLAGAAGVALVLWLILRERGALALAIAAAAFVLHTVLDMIGGGVPLWWPWSSQRVGGDFLDLDSGVLERRVLREILLFAPIAAIGIAMGVGRHVWAPNRRMPMRTSAEQRRPWIRHAWQLAPLIPLAALAVAQVDGQRLVAKADALRAAGRCEGAIALLQKAPRMRGLGVEAASWHRIGICQRVLGRDQDARATYDRCLAAYPGDVMCSYGLGVLLTRAADPAVRDPREAIGHFEHVARETSNAVLRDAVLDEIARARRDAATDSDTMIEPPP